MKKYKATWYQLIAISIVTVIYCKNSWANEQADIVIDLDVQQSIEKSIADSLSTTKDNNGDDVQKEKIEPIVIPTVIPTSAAGNENDNSQNPSMNSKVINQGSVSTNVQEVQNKNQELHKVAAPTQTKVINFPKFSLINAIDRGNVDYAIYLIHNGYPVNEIDSFGISPLMKASSRGYADIVQLLIYKKAAINARDFGGATALHIASRQGNTDVVRILLRNGAHVNIKDHEGWTPLMRAASFNRKEIIELLLQKRILSADLQNITGERAIDIAVDGGKYDATTLLLDHYKRKSQINPNYDPQIEKLISIAKLRNDSRMTNLLISYINDSSQDNVASHDDNSNINNIMPSPEVAEGEAVVTASQYQQAQADNVVDASNIEDNVVDASNIDNADMITSSGDNSKMEYVQGKPWVTVAENQYQDQVIPAAPSGVENSVPNEMQYEMEYNPQGNDHIEYLKNKPWLN